MVRTAWLVICIALTALAGSIPVRHAAGQERPRSGGELVLLVPSEPPSYDGHREGTFGTVHPLAPVYNTLLRIDPTDRTGTRPAPHLARREGELRQDRLSASRHHLGAQGRLPGRGSDRGA